MGPDLQENQADQNWAREGKLKAEACPAQTHNRQPIEPMNSIWKDLLPPLSESTRKERDSPGRKGRWKKEGKIASKERNIGRSPSLSTVANSSTEDKRNRGAEQTGDRLIIPGLDHPLPASVPFTLGRRKETLRP